MTFIEEGQHDTTRVIGYVELAKRYRNETPEKAIFYIDKGEELIQKKLSEGGEYKDFYLNRLTMIYNVSGVIYRRFGNYPEALRNYKKAPRLLEKVDNKTVYASTLFNIGKLYRIQGDYNESIKYYNQSLELRKRILDSMGLINCYREIGLILNDQNDHKLALESFEKGIEIARSYNNIPKLLEVCTKQAELYLAKGDYQLVKDSLDAVIPILRKDPIRFTEEYGDVAIIYAKALYATGKVQQGIDMVEKTLYFVKETKEAKSISELYGVAAEGYQKLGKYNDANRYLNLKITTDSIIAANSNTAEVARIEMNYLFKKKRVADSLKLLDEKEISRLK